MSRKYFSSTQVTEKLMETLIKYGYCKLVVSVSSRKEIYSGGKEGTGKIKIEEITGKRDTEHA